MIQAPFVLRILAWKIDTRRMLESGSPPSEVAIVLVSELRAALRDLADKQTDTDERVRLRNMASMLPDWNVTLHGQKQTG
jgi:hypothetical protein